MYTRCHYRIRARPRAPWAKASGIRARYPKVAVPIRYKPCTMQLLGCRQKRRNKRKEAQVPAPYGRNCPNGAETATQNRMGHKPDRQIRGACGGGAYWKTSKTHRVQARVMYMLGGATTERTGGGTKGNAPHCTPKTSVSTPLHLHLPLSTRLDEISLAPAGHIGVVFGPFGAPGAPRGPMQPSHLAQIF
jgi:hypothetical protein